LCDQTNEYRDKEQINTFTSEYLGWNLSELPRDLVQRSVNGGEVYFRLGTETVSVWSNKRVRATVVKW